MKILWVEDRNDILTSGIFENKYFNLYLSKQESENLARLKQGNFKKVKKFLKNTKNKVFLASNLGDAIEIIENNSPFEKIILDINFPIENFDLYKYLEEDFIGEENTYKSFLDNIKDEFAGIILNHIIVTKYKDEFNWDKKDILEKIVFLSGNGIKFNDFDKRINSMYGKSFKYDTDASEIEFFDKKKDESLFLKWLKADEYTIILDRYINASAIENYLEISQNKDSEDDTIIKGNLVNLRQLLETYIAKTIVKKIADNEKYLPKWKPQLKGTHGINFGGFISMLNQVIPNMDRRHGEETGYFFATKEEINQLLKNINKDFKFKEETGNYKLRMNSLMALIEQKNEHSFNSFIKTSKKLEDLTFHYQNRLNTELFVTETLFNYIKNSWSILSELIHDEKNLTRDGEKFINNTPKAVNTINILYFQLREIILWFADVMEKLDK